MTIQPGDLVIPRVRFALHSRDLGIVVGDLGHSGVADWLVMWVLDDQVKFTNHMDNGLLRIEDATLHKAKERSLGVSR